MSTARFRSRPIALSIGTAGELPTEFCLFVRGWNDSEKGTVLFDDVAAREVMAAYAKWGVDLAIDLEHQMLIDDAGPDPTARDARGWAKLELRSDGSLWAVDVTWTADGAERLTQKRQRYVSPAFFVHPKTRRVTKVLNVALTAVPATHKTPALVAASINGAGMDPKQIAAALDALIAGDSEKCADMLKGLIASAASGEGEGEAASGDMLETESQTSDEPAGDVAVDAEEPKAQAVAASLLIKLSGKSNLAEALGEVAAWRSTHIATETERAKLAEQREALESAERKRLCAELIKLGAEFPATVWANDKATELKPRWSKMGLDELKSTVAEQRAARGGVQTKAKPPTGAGNGAGGGEGSKTFNVEGALVTLDARELAICEETKCEPKVFAMLKGRRSKGTT